MPRKKTKNTRYDEYIAARELSDKRMMKESYLKDMCKRMVFFAYESDGSDYVTSFVAQEGMPLTSFKKYCKDHEYVRDAYEEAREILASRALKNGLLNKFNPLLTRWYITMISPTFFEYNKRIKNAQDEKKDAVVVIKEIKADENQE